MALRSYSHRRREPHPQFRAFASLRSTGSDSTLRRREIAAACFVYHAAFRLAWVDAAADVLDGFESWYDVVNTRQSDTSTLMFVPATGRVVNAMRCGRRIVLGERSAGEGGGRRWSTRWRRQCSGGAFCLKVKSGGATHLRNLSLFLARSLLRQMNQT